MSQCCDGTHRVLVGAKLGYADSIDLGEDSWWWLLAASPLVGVAVAAATNTFIITAIDGH